MVINRPVEEVFAFVTDFEKTPQWRPAVLELKVTSEGPVGVGTTYREMSRFMGRRRETAAEVTEFEPNEKFAVKVTGTPIGAIQATFTFTTVEGGTRLDTAGQAAPDGLFKLLQPLIRAATVKQMNTDNANLKRLLEGEG